MTDPERVLASNEVFEKLRDFYDESLDPNIVGFAHFLAGRLDDLEMIPSGVILGSSLAAYDLEQGKDGFTGEPINSELVGLNQEEYMSMLRGVADIADAVFPPDFAEDVKNEMRRVGLLAPIDAELGNALVEGEIISDSIDDIDTAMSLIVDDARQKAVDLDWQHFGITREQASEAFDVGYLLALRHAPYDLALNLFLDDKEHEKGLIAELLPHQKRVVMDNYYVGLTSSPIPPEFAIFTRDHLYLKSPEIVASVYGVDPHDVVAHFAEDKQSPLYRAAIRLQTFIAEHPYLEH